MRSKQYQWGESTDIECFKIKIVGMTGLEPAASRPPDEHSTGLSYIPKRGANL